MDQPNIPVRVVLYLCQLPLYLWAGARLMLDYLGRASVVSDFGKPDTFSALAAKWVFSTPWWVPAVLASVGTLAWLYAMLREHAYKMPVDRPSLWSENARLTLVFNAELQDASAINQDEVRYYYWYHFPSVAVNFESREVTASAGYVMVFMSLREPTHTNYCQVRVLGGGVHCEMISHHPTGAVVRATGDLRGRTLDVRFSKAPISID